MKKKAKMGSRRRGDKVRGTVFIAIFLKMAGRKRYAKKKAHFECQDGTQSEPFLAYVRLSLDLLWLSWPILWLSGGLCRPSLDQFGVSWAIL